MLDNLQRPAQLGLDVAHQFSGVSRVGPHVLHTRKHIGQISQEQDIHILRTESPIGAVQDQPEVMFRQEGQSKPGEEGIVRLNLNKT